MVSVPHIISLVNYVKHKNISKMVEIGTAKGGVIALCAMANPNTIIYGFDSWKGMPPLTEKDDIVHKKYENVVWSSINDVYESFEKLESPMNNVRLVKGYIENTLDNYLKELQDIDILRLDVDWYAGTLLALKKLYNNVIPGGLIIIDDYYFNIGCKKAVDEYRENNHINSVIYHDKYNPDLVYWFKN
jgi:O-methyltransferase